MSSEKRRKPDLNGVFALLSPAIADAARTASQRLTASGIRHVLAGGLAASAYGEPRATRDVDFLVGDEAFVHQGSIVTLNPHVPLAVGRVPIDVLPIPEDARHLEDAL